MHFKIPSKKLLVSSAILLFLVLTITSAGIYAAYNYHSEKPVNIFEETKNECPGIKWIKPADSSQYTRPVTIEGDLYFAGEKVPLEDPDVQERLDLELQINLFWRSNTIMDMKLANRYFNEIEKILQDSGVPTDFKYMALIESNLRYETSPAGAAGFWQFVKGTAKSLHLEVNDEVDERYNVEKSTQAACAFLKDAKERLGSWTLAAAAYDLGVPAMMERIKDQKASNYYDMFFNPETSRYVFRMLALKIIFSDPKSAGFVVSPKQLYQPYKYKVVEVDSAIASVADFASQYGLRYKHIKILNPWLRDAKLTNKERKKYEIRILEMN